MGNKNRLYRNTDDCFIGGVCYGISDKLGIDPTYVRVLWALFIFLFGYGLLLYILLWIIMPENEN